MLTKIRNKHNIGCKLYALYTAQKKRFLPSTHLNSLTEYSLQKSNKQVPTTVIFSDSKPKLLVHQLINRKVHITTRNRPQLDTYSVPIKKTIQSPKQDKKVFTNWLSITPYQHKSQQNRQSYKHRTRVISNRE